jgi:hypothetical protein
MGFGSGVLLGLSVRNGEVALAMVAGFFISNLPTRRKALSG